MGLFTWDEKYSIRNEELDRHHKHLFNLINQLHDICSTTRDVDSLKVVIDELAQYTNYHFSEEEKYMRSKGYKNVEAHISNHEIFREKIIQLQQEGSRNMVVARELMIFLGTWLLDHVLEEDIEISG